ncbi:MAG: N-acetylneuraminate synthase family protein [Aminobacterium colombiense]|jgi:sialic acid synthase SpsE|uniref:N-acetylneuraminate synthase family protein n=1 Tax=Aminobacterium colombiense TaxID=81468 RepID=UPI00184150FF|nr:acetylneuraminic acid synthetase [Bacteroidales bacterium]
MEGLRIGKKLIRRGSLSKPYLIMEAGVNHEGDIKKAKTMIEQAAKSGADAIKFQTYKAASLASKFSPSYWDTTKEPTTSQYSLFQKYDSFWKEEYEELARCSAIYGIDFLSTPFDFESADFLDPLMPAFKVASADITNTPLLKHIAKKGKPMLISTGASYIWEIWQAIETIQREGNNKIVLLHCVLNYPTPYENANLAMIADMCEHFPDFVIGYSDHTLPEKSAEVLTTAWLLGAQILEKHFTFDKSLPGNDHYHALDKDDLLKFTDCLSFMSQILGEKKKRPLKDEEISRINARRSLVAAHFIAKGQKISEEDLKIKRPGTGISPIFLEFILGSTAMRDIDEDKPIQFGDFSKESLKRM